MWLFPLLSFLSSGLSMPTHIPSEFITTNATKRFKTLHKCLLILFQIVSSITLACSLLSNKSNIIQLFFSLLLDCNILVFPALCSWNVIVPLSNIYFFWEDYTASFFFLKNSLALSATHSFDSETAYSTLVVTCHLDRKILKGRFLHPLLTLYISMLAHLLTLSSFLP